MAESRQFTNSFFKPHQTGNIAGHGPVYEVMTIFMGELVHPPPPVIAFHIEAYTVVEFSHFVNFRTFILIKNKTVTCQKHLVAYPAGKVYLDLLKQPVYNLFIVRSKVWVFGNVNVSGYSIYVHESYLALQI